VVGTDPGTSSLDLLLLEDGRVADQKRFTPREIRQEPEALQRLLASWRPLDLVAAPSGYGLPLVRGENLTADHVDQMAFVRPDERGRDSGVIGFRSWVRAFAASGQPLVFLPGGLHLPTIPPHRKINAIDLGTADKVAVAALALWFDAENTGGFDRSTFAVVELGTVFAAILVVRKGRLVDVAAGTRGPIGARSQGAWDGELAYWRSPLAKADLFRGGLDDLGEHGLEAFRESLIKHVAGLQAVTPFDRVYLSGASMDRPEIADVVENSLSRFGSVARLPSLPGAWVKHAAQGSAMVADALAGGRFGPLADVMRLHDAQGTIWDAAKRTFDS
jgi:predicted butyrate kinase (DUF1464 family)